MVLLMECRGEVFSPRATRGSFSGIAAGALQLAVLGKGLYSNSESRGCPRNTGYLRDPKK